MTYTDDIIAASPVAYYTLDDSDSIARDSSGNGRNGSYNGSPIRAIRSPVLEDLTRGVFLRQSSSAWVRSSSDSALAFSANATIEAWLVWRSGVAILRDSTNADGWVLAINSSGTIHVRAGGTNFNTGISSDVLQDGRWHHVVLTKSGGAVTFYVDGAVAYAGSGAGSTAAVMPWRINRNGTSTSNVYGNTGFIHVAFYNYALSPAQVAGHFHSPRQYNEVLASAGTTKVRHIGSTVIETVFEQSLPAYSLVSATSPPSPGVLVTLGSYTDGTELRFRLDGSDAQDNLSAANCVVSYYPTPPPPSLDEHPDVSEVDGPCYILWWENPSAGSSRDYNDLHSWVWTSSPDVVGPTVGYIGPGLMP